MSNEQQPLIPQKEPLSELIPHQIRDAVESRNELPVEDKPQSESAMTERGNTPGIITRKRERIAKIAKGNIHLSRRILDGDVVLPDDDDPTKA
jgi:hypothetical protein